MELDTLSLKLAGLADPTRRAILQRLASGEATVIERIVYISSFSDAEGMNASMQQGFKGTFEQLETCLADVQAA